MRLMKLQERSGDEVKLQERSGDEVKLKERSGDEVKLQQRSGDEVKLQQRSGDKVKQEVKQMTEETEKDKVDLVMDEGKTPSGSTQLADIDLLHMYKETASIHGVAKIGSPALYSRRQLLWLILVCGMAVGLSVMLYLEFLLYFQYPTNTLINARFASSLHFPAVTICNLNQFHRQRIPKDYRIHQLLYEMSEFDSLQNQDHDMLMGSLANAGKPSEWKGEDMHRFASNAAHRLDDMFSQCFWHSARVNCSSLFKQTVTDLGFCYTFNGNGSGQWDTIYAGPFSGLRLIVNIEQQHYYFSMTTQAGIKVLFHEPNSPAMALNSGVFVQPGSSTSVALTKEVRKNLSPPYKAFGEEFCEDTDAPGYETPLTRYGGSLYTHQSCIMECIRNPVIRHCGCRHFFDTGNEPFCSLDQLTKCYINEMAAKNRSSNCCRCRSACRRTKYVPSISVADFASTFIVNLMYKRNITENKNYIRENMIDLRIYYETLTVMQIDQTPLVTITGIMGDLGGQMGLFLGASILSLMELFEIIGLLLSRVCNKIKAGHNIDTKAKPNCTNVST